MHGKHYYELLPNLLGNSKFYTVLKFLRSFFYFLIFMTKLENTFVCSYCYCIKTNDIFEFMILARAKLFTSQNYNPICSKNLSPYWEIFYYIVNIVNVLTYNLLNVLDYKISVHYNHIRH